MPACSGTVARHGPERWPGMPRNQWSASSGIRSHRCAALGLPQRVRDLLVGKSLALHGPLLPLWRTSEVQLSPVLNCPEIGNKVSHSIDDNDLGPKHRGVVGRHAGSVADYAYSPALKNSGLTWDEANLDRWLSNPSALVPGTKMFFKIDDPQARADIIAYLQELK